MVRGWVVTQDPLDKLDLTDNIPLGSNRFDPRSIPGTSYSLASGKTSEICDWFMPHFALFHPPGSIGAVFS